MSTLATATKRKAMESCIEILIVKLLHATKDAALKAISSQLPCQDEKIIIIINSLSKLVNRLSQENLMAHLSTFFPALLDAFENHSPYVRKVVNPLPLFSTDSVFNKALSFWAHVLIVLHLLEFTCTKRL
ncbi:uncharacterized protein LOC120699605 isoform X2 [Panicum virgatum]|uniref:uncharacterized protein LOC120699605 isoform X2 n=1 Tax=Panicum virgatum TaxID=38727 RepID=UPI0019D65C7D|nr:uncharacterized protein LOC120699605 isoform X2 [Panicum virgatum]